MQTRCAAGNPTQAHIKLQYIMKSVFLLQRLQHLDGTRDMTEPKLSSPVQFGHRTLTVSCGWNLEQRNFASICTCNRCICCKQERNRYGIQRKPASFLSLYVVVYVCIKLYATQLKGAQLTWNETRINAFGLWKKSYSPHVHPSRPQNNSFSGSPTMRSRCLYTALDESPKKFKCLRKREWASRHAGLYQRQTDLLPTLSPKKGILA